jgi:hypothetical protein
MYPAQLQAYRDNIAHQSGITVDGQQGSDPVHFHLVLFQQGSGCFLGDRWIQVGKGFQLPLLQSFSRSSIASSK